MTGNYLSPEFANFMKTQGQMQGCYSGISGTTDPYMYMAAAPNTGIWSQSTNWNMASRDMQNLQNIFGAASFLPEPLLMGITQPMVNTAMIEIIKKMGFGCFGNSGCVQNSQMPWSEIPPNVEPPKAETVSELEKQLEDLKKQLKDMKNVTTDKTDTTVVTKEETVDTDKEVKEDDKKDDKAKRKELTEEEKANVKDICSKLYKSMHNCGTNKRELQDGVNLITKDNVIEVLDHWNNNYSKRMDNQTLVKTIVDELDYFDDTSSYINPVKDALRKRAKESGLEDKAIMFDENVDDELNAGFNTFEDVIVENFNNLHRHVKIKENPNYKKYLEEKGFLKKEGFLKKKQTESKGKSFQYHPVSENY